MLTWGPRRWGSCGPGQPVRAKYCAATERGVCLLVLQGLCGPPLALDNCLRWAGAAARRSVERVTSHRHNGDRVSLGISGCRSDNDCGVWLWNEQVSGSPGCFWGGGFCGRGWSRPMWCFLSALFLDCHLCLVMGLGLKSWLLQIPYRFWPPSATASFCSVLCSFALYYYASYHLSCECLTLNSPLLRVVLQRSICIELCGTVFFLIALYFYLYCLVLLCVVVVL